MVLDIFLQPDSATTSSVSGWLCAQGAVDQHTKALSVRVAETRFRCIFICHLPVAPLAPRCFHVANFYFLLSKNNEENSNNAIFFGFIGRLQG
jgi:hypothetical protein